ncbi:MAG: S-layer homology domain-containing protein [bacterium]
MKRQRILAALLLVLLLAGAGTAAAAPGYAPGPAGDMALGRALEYLHQAQNADGGFPASPGGPSSSQVTAWVVMALAAAGEDPAGVYWAPGGTSPVAYLKSKDKPASTADYARSLLALAAAGEGEGAKAKELARVLAGRQQADGRLGLAGAGEEGLINYHIWSLLALAAVGQAPPQREKALQWLKEQQNDDGGFCWYAGGPSDPDDTAVAIQALLAQGEAVSSPAVARALAYLDSCQEKDGGFRWEGPRSNLATSAWVMQALLAAGEDPQGPRWQVAGKGVVDFLLTMQNGDGSFLWQKGVLSSPVQMTAYGVMALAGKHFPLAGKVSSGQGAFSDLPPTHWAYQPLEKLAAAGIFSGYPDGTIRPEKEVTRAEFATLLARALKLEGRGEQAPLSFTDVPPGHWARDAIAAAAAAGFIRGRSDTVFDPESSITGGEVMAMLIKALPPKEQTAGAAGPHWYSLPVSVAEKQGLLYPGFDPVQRASRGQCAYSLEKLLALLGKR